MSEHALLSPSAASRWLACTPSARLEKLFTDKAGSAAEEGTLAHAIGELMTKRKLGRINLKQYTSDLKKLQAHPLHTGKDMDDYMDDYASYIMERFAEAQARTADAAIFLETRFDLTKYVPEGFGTGDVNIISDHILDFIDLKYGKGVKVSAQQNKQMMLYGLGSYEQYSMLYDIKIVRMTIYQPRLDHIDTYETSVEGLLKWGHETLIPKARLAFAGEGPYAPGDHCRFCRAKTTCRANADFQLDIARHEFKSLDLLTDEELVDVFKRYDSFTNWIKGVADHMTAEAIKGREWPGLKLVEGKSNRKWSDEAKIIEVLKEKGYEENDYYSPRKLKGLGDMQKELGKADFNKYLDPLIIKPKGAPALALEDDKRPIFIVDAASDFKDFKPEDE